MFAASTLTPKQIRRASLIIFVVGIALMAATMLVGPGDQGRQALAADRLRLDPAVRVRQARFRGADRLAVQREPEAAATCPASSLPLALYGIFAAAARAPARFRPDAARHPRLDRAVLHGRHQSVLDRRARLRRASPVSRRPIFSCRMSPRASTASSIRPPATPIRPTSALNSFLHGGWFGRGPGEGTVKDVLPDSHTDFIFAVAAEEYGLIACLILLAAVCLHRAARPVQGIAGA